MSLRITPFVSGEYYHLYNRGNSKQKIFLDEADYNRFLKLLFLCNSKLNINFRNIIDITKDIFDFDRDEMLVDIGAFCLMPNHFHLLVREGKDNNVSLFMKKLMTAYVMYFNKKYERTGALFEGKFKSEHAGEDNYLKYLFSYIHLNPVKLIDPKWMANGIKDKIKAQKYALGYEYSSYACLGGEGQKWIKLINPPAFPKYFTNAKQYQKETFEWLDSSPRKDLGEHNSKI
ncbi:MAG: transposase [Patescibacteria group bacterium]